MAFGSRAVSVAEPGVLDVFRFPHDDVQAAAQGSSSDQTTRARLMTPNLGLVVITSIGDAMAHPAHERVQYDRAGEAVVVARAPARERWSWALYDFANTIFSMNIATLYFTAWMVEDLGSTNTLYAATNGVASALVVLCIPVLGAISDARRRRKRSAGANRRALSRYRQNRRARTFRRKPVGQKPARQTQTDAERTALLLRNVINVPWEQRTARFRAVVAIAG